MTKPLDKDLDWLLAHIEDEAELNELMGLPECGRDTRRAETIIRRLLREAGYDANRRPA